MLEDKSLEINAINITKNNQDLELCLDTNEKEINNVSLELQDKTH